MPQNQNRDQIEPGDGDGGGGDNEDDNVINSQDSRQGLNRDNCQDLKSSNSDKRTNRLPQASGSSASLRSQELVDGLTNNTRGQPEAAPTRRQSAANNQLSPSPRPTFELTSSPSSSSSARIELGSDEEGGESPASTAIQHHHMDANNNAGHIALDVAGDNRPAEAREQQQRLSRSPRPAQDNRQARVYSVNSTNTQTTSCDEPSSCAGNLDKPGLLYCSREPLKLKDFRIEVRAPMDVEQFCHQAELLLDLGETSMNGIIEAMLAKVAKNDGIGSEKLEEIRRSIFIPGSAVLMARTIHGFYTATDNQDHQQTSAALSHDQSWLCALCNLSQVSKRHMVFARFKQPINMGENAHEVRLFVLIVVPAKEKSTKDQVETGRTFGSMLTDADFRQRLLRARDEIEFKALMMAKAQQMARAHRLKNRHKYRLDPILNESISSVSLYDGQADDPLFHMKSVHSEPGGRGDRNNVNDEGDDGDRDEEDCDDNDEDNEHVFDSSTGDEPILVSSKSLNNLGDGSVGGIGSNNNSSSKSEDGLKARLTSFHRNPRTSKLFELINSNGSADAGASKKGGVIRGVPIQLGSLDTSKLRELEEIEKWNSGWRGVLSGLNLKFGQGAWDDFRRRLKYYASDFKDAFVGPPRTIQKTVATIWFLYFGVLLPTIAFSSLNTIQTHGHMGDLRKAIIGQAIGGLGFALLGGQPLVIIMTTAPLCLYTRVIHQMCLDYGFPFPAMYAAVGLWNGLFLVVYSLFGFSELMKWCTRSTEEIFALFIVVAFVTDAGKDLVKNFKRFYFAPACEAQDNRTMAVMTDANRSMLAVLDPSSTANLSSTTQVYRDIEEEIESSVCRRETSLLFVLLMLGTLWLAITLYRFRRTPYLSQAKREALADYALPTAVILMSLIGSTVFDNIYVEKFPPLLDLHFEWARIDLLPWTGVLTSMGLGFTLSLLFFMDQNISAAMVMAPQNRLKKGAAYHYDLLIVGLLNGALTLYGLPMMHGVLPHSPLHARSLADIEERIEEGHLREVVVNSRETRVTAIVAHILVLLSLFLIPYPIAYIPRAVLNGLFLYMAVTSLDGLQVFERILLLVTEQNKYPPNHYIRRCPQRKIHQFTLLQICQLAIMCLFGFSPITIVEMLFPVLILLMIPFRHTIIPKYIEEKYLDALDGKGH